LNGQHSVLIVDRSEETREVLRTVLERHGVRTLAADRAKTGIELARRHQPDLIVLDLETCETGETPAWDSAGETPVPPYEPRMVLLGSLRDYRRRLAGGEFVAKPYHYGPLIRRIEELLENTGTPGPCPRSSLSAEPIRAAVTS
jgi:CheY-like chemotaxis protein